jgi:hypothetical protein
MASASITLSGLDGITEFGTSSPKEILQRLENLLSGIENGAQSCVSLQVVTSATDAVAASCEITATTSGSLGTVIGGTTVTTTFTVSQDATATQAVADINANTTVNKWVRASKGSVTNKFMLTAIVPGAIGNNVTTTVTGTGASAASAKLAGGTGIDTGLNTYVVQ